MALVKFGGGITQMTGSIAGNTYARNRSGNYVRSRTKPVNPNTSRQGVCRSIIGTLTQSWRTVLDDAERLAWATYANSIAMKNKLGETTYLSGFNHFVRSNSVRLLSLKAQVDAGPTELALPEKDPTLAVTASAATGILTLDYDVTQPWCSEVGAFLAISQGQPQNATRNFFAGPWKFIGVINQNAVPSYTVNASFTLVEGQKTWIAVRICRADGRVSEIMYASCTIAA